MSLLSFPLFQRLRGYWEQYPLVLAIAGLLALAGLVLVWDVGSIGLIDETEPMFVEAARQMKLSGDWITPYFNEATRFDKPPLIYWLMVLSFNLFGVSEWAARLPSVLSALALALLCFYALWQIPFRETSVTPAERSRLPFVAATLTLCNVYTVAWGRTGHSDMLLSACLGGSLFCFFLAYAQPHKPIAQQGWYLAFYELMGFAVLTKGPIGVVLPGLIIGLFLGYVGHLRAICREMRLWHGILVVLLVALPWYILVTFANGDAFIDSFFGYHNFDRFVTVVNRHKEPWYYHFLVVLVAFLPWSAYLPAAIAHQSMHRRRFWQAQSRSQQLSLFCGIWVAVVLGFFTIATTKVPSYTLPLVPAAAILVAQFWLADPLRLQGRSKEPRSLWLSGWLNVVFVLGMASICFLSPRLLSQDPAMPLLGQRFQSSGLFAIGTGVWGFTALGLILLLLQRCRWFWTVNVAGWLAFLLWVVHPAIAIVDTERQLPLRQLAQVAVQQQQPKEPLVLLGFEKPSLVYYTQKPVQFIYKTEKFRLYLQSNLGLPQQIPSLLVVTSRQPWAKVGLAPSQYTVIADAPPYQLIRLTPESFQRGR